jgi:hypothetical protein
MVDVWDCGYTTPPPVAKTNEGTEELSGNPRQGHGSLPESRTVRRSSSGRL